MPKRAAIALILVFVATRALSAWFAYSPTVYLGDTNVSGDVSYYNFNAQRIMDGGEKPYEDVKVEYPPGSLLLITTPYALSSDPDTYRLLYIGEMLLVDALGLVALLVLGRRWGSHWGAWAWVLLIPLLGPVAHARLDLVPAVLTIWAFERASAGRWLESGAMIGIGTAVKLYPIALLPILLLVAWRKRQLLIGTALPILAALIPYAGSLPEVWDSVIGYQTERGIQVESTWGLLLLSVAVLGYGLTVVYNFGAFHVSSSASGFFDVLATAASALSALVVYRAAYRGLERTDVRGAALPSFALMALLLPAAAVWSPQFLLWVIALGAVLLAAYGERFAYVGYVLAGGGVASQLIYPFFYNDLLGARPLPSLLLLTRNVALLIAGLLVLRELAPRAAAASPPPVTASASRPG